MKNLITAKEQAANLSISPRHLINLTSKRLVPCVRLGRSIRYNPEAVQRAIEKLTVREVS